MNNNFLIIVNIVNEHNVKGPGRKFDLIARKPCVTFIYSTPGVIQLIRLINFRSVGTYLTK